ncbi:MAG TPA: hypothetical protein VK306_05985 [Acidimicrobiales bacterium]|nr:hypothetical protein [Acidimicrobiales bacterium]
MALVDDKPAAEQATAAKIDALATRRRAGPATLAKRYAPFVAMVVAIAAVIVVFGGDGGGDGTTTEVASEAAATDELVASGPMTWQRAELEGVTDQIEWGPTCDTERGTIKLPAVWASPCVEPFTGDNGGATSQGVTADEVKIIYYQSDPALDPLGASLVSASGADVDVASANQVIAAYTDLYSSLFETYGRKVVVEPFTGSGASDDREAARADAAAIAEKKPFAVVGGPLQSGSTFAIELASRGIVCGPTCATALPESIVDEYYPYIWQQGPTPDQSAALAAEMVGKLAGPGPAELAGDPALQSQDRRYALVHYDTAEGDHEAVFEALRDALADNGVELTTDVEYQLDLARSQETARTIMSKLESDDITTVIYYGDPLTPASLTEEATAQDYHPEWILGPSLLMDTTIFARRTDPDQWKNGFGLSLVSARGERSTIDAFSIYEWAYGEEPPNNTVSVLEPLVRLMFSGIHLAGPELTPETFRDGLYRAPPVGGGPTDAQVSRGNHGVWPDEDRGGSDDATVIWWDPEATGEDETGNPGTGMYRYANGGERYTLGHFPDSPEDAGLFDVDSSVIVYDSLPESDVPPEYPSPNLTPPTG